NRNWLVFLPTRRSEIPEGQGPGAENHLLPRVRRPPYSLQGDRAGRLRRTSELIAVMDTSCELRKRERSSCCRRRRAERTEDGYGTDRQIAAERAEWFHPEGIEATRMTEPRRVWRFLPVGTSAYRNLRSWAAGWVRRRRSDDSLDVTLMPCVSDPVFRPTGRLTATTG